MTHCQVVAFALTAFLVSESAAAARANTRGGADARIASSSKPDDVDRVTGAVPPGASTTASHFEDSTDVCWGLNDFCPGGTCDASTSIAVSGVSGTVWDVDVTTFIRHEWNSDLSISVTSPEGTTVVLSEHRGQIAADGFDGALFDDSAAILVTDHFYMTDGPPGPVVPEGALSRFVGEDPNGTWTIDIHDSFCFPKSLSHIEGWALDITSLDTPLTPSSTLASDSTPLSITDPGIVQSMILVSGAGSSLCDVNLTTSIAHTWSSDLAVSVISPAGTTVVLSTRNGGQLDDVFDGTLWDDQADLSGDDELVTQHFYVDGVLATPLVGEGKLARFIGEDPNGTWTLRVQDVTGTHPGLNSGTLQSWSLDITTCSSEPGAAYCFGDGLDPVVTAACPCGNFGDPGRGCANSNATLGGARLYATGATSPNTVVLYGEGLNNNTLCTFFRGPNHDPQAGVFGDGIKCINPPLFRFGQQNSGQGGNDPFTIAVTAPTELPGSVFHYAIHYRNPIGGFCDPGLFNASNGYTIEW